jgi:predicted ATPase
MRNYVPERASDLKRSGENISAAVANLDRHDRETYGKLVEITSKISDNHVRAINIIRSEIGDAMMGIREGRTKKTSEFTPAREMSDGLLRFIAIATALLTSNRGLDIDPGISTDQNDESAVLLVIEELENGLHPSQAGRVLRFIKEVIGDLPTKVVLTTHSPALLNEMTGDLNNSIIVCYRDSETGESKLSRLPNLTGYAEAMSAGRVGDVVSEGSLVRPVEHEANIDEFRRLLGVE